LVAKPKLIYLEWVDSCGNASRVWHNRDEAVECITPLVCRSVGFVVEETRDYLTIAAHAGGDEVSGVMSIPKCAIKKRRRIKL
jgi:hypothetical protein